jgi:hypothetical protein
VLSPNIYVTGGVRSTNGAFEERGRPVMTVVRFATARAGWYNSGMTVDQFRATLHQLPFRPFTIRMADGRSFDVIHRDVVAHSPSGRTVIVFDKDEDYSVLDLLLMSELEVHDGSRRRRGRK